MMKYQIMLLYFTHKVIIVNIAEYFQIKKIKIKAYDPYYVIESKEVLRL